MFKIQVTNFGTFDLLLQYQHNLTLKVSLFWLHMWNNEKQISNMAMSGFSFSQKHTFSLYTNSYCHKFWPSLYLLKPSLHANKTDQVSFMHRQNTKGYIENGDSEHCKKFIPQCGEN